jgi:nucleoside-diphosphate-sugar epimerase
MTRPACLVTGATGMIGPAVVTALSATHDIRTLSRETPAAGLFSAPVSVFRGDVTDLQSVRKAVAGTDLVVHLAALLHISDPSPDLRREYERVNVEGTGAVITAAREEGVRRVVVVSTIAVYGPRRHEDTKAGRIEGTLLDEDSPARPPTLYAKTKLAAEHLALAARRPDGHFLATVLRPAAVFGPRLKGNYAHLVRALARRRFVPVGPGDNRRTLVFDEDLASAIAIAAERPEAAGRLYNVTDGGTHSMREIIAAMCAALGRPTPRWRIPVAPVRAAAAVASVFGRRLGSALETYLEDVAVSGRRIETELGFRPRVGLEEGWARTIAGMRHAGAL